MKIEEEILFNKHGQGLITDEELMGAFNIGDNIAWSEILNHLEYIIIQSKSDNYDINQAIINAKLKPSHTPCVIFLKNGISHGSFIKLGNLPTNEREKVFKLLLNLFRLSYRRRWLDELNNPNKWWYWDLSNPVNLKMIIEKYSEPSP